MISNPCTFFINGNDQESFNYEGGKELYHFSPYDNKLSNSMEKNLCFFANSELHGLDVLKRMFKFMIDCNIKYLKTKYDGAHSDDFKEKAKNNCSDAQIIIDAINKGKVKLIKAPKNQFYMVGWAANDTI